MLDQFSHYGFDDEGRVGLDDFHDIVAGRLAGGGEQGLDPAQGFRRGALIAIGPEAGNGGIDVGNVETGQLVGVEIVEDLAQETLFGRVQRLARCGLLAFDEGPGEGVMQRGGGLGRRGAGNEFIHGRSCLF